MAATVARPMLPDVPHMKHAVPHHQSATSENGWPPRAKDRWGAKDCGKAADLLLTKREQIARPILVMQSRFWLEFNSLLVLSICVTGSAFGLYFLA